MSQSSLAALEKAQRINSDPAIYGTFAEIGAGQEIARFFFQAGKASQTIAKTMSAYDMVFSDEIYGREANGRYVCESRLLKMLTKEYDLLQRRLSQVRGDRSHFFALADTVTTTARDESGRRVSSGWMGIRFQKAPHAPTNDILIHVRLLDRYRLLQQEALGVLGVNLVHAAFFAAANHKDLVHHLTDGIRKGQIAIDYLKCTGPAFSQVNEALLNLQILRSGFGEIILFSEKGEIASLPDSVFNRSLVIERGNFHPVTNTHVDLLEKGRSHLALDFQGSSEKLDSPLAFFEMTLKNLGGNEALSEEDFLLRLKCLNATGHAVIISNLDLFYKLKRYLRQFTQKPLGLIVSAHFLPKIFENHHYQDLEGGLLEGLSKLLDPQTKILVYPHKSGQTCKTSKTFFPEGGLRKIYDYFLDCDQITDLAGCDEIEEYVHSEQVMEMIHSGAKTWEAQVPEQVRKILAERS